MGWKVLSAIRGGGGGVVIWDEVVVEVEGCISRNCSISCLFINRASKKRWAFTEMYDKDEGGKGIVVKGL